MGTRLASQSSLDLNDYLPKKLKKSYKPDVSQFSRGSIIKVKLENFMSYSLTEFHFGPNMNLIIGPNGTGKSTFVCAVCIGLAGKLDYLGKASMNLDQFIKTGEKQALIELELKGEGDDETLKIVRELNKKAKSNWYLNNRSSNEAQIKKYLKEFNIQLDNLCQFLPQDRVARFASLKPEELLREIERLYQDGELLVQHTHLEELYTERQEKKKSLGEVEQQLSDLQQKRESLQEKARQYQEYQSLELELQKHEQIRPYVELSSRKRSRDALKGEITEVSNQIIEFDNKFLPMKESIRQFDQNLENTEDKVRKYETLQKSTEHEVKALLEKLKELDEEIKNLSDQRDSLTTSLESHQERWRKLVEDFQKSKNTLDELEILDDETATELRNRRSQLEDQTVDDQEPIDRLEFDKRALITANNKYQERIQFNENLLNSKDKLVSLDERRYGSLIKAVKLLREKGKALGIKYFEPPIISLSVTEKKYGPALERALKFQDQTAFIVPDNTEYRKLSNLLYSREHSEIGKQIGIRTLSDNFNMEPKVSRAEIKKFNFDGYLVDFVTGPKEVIQMVCENGRINNIPIALNDLEDSVKNTLKDKISKENFPVTEFISGEAFYNLSRSNYGSRQVTTNIRTFSSSRPSIFSDGIPEDKRREIQGLIDGIDTTMKENSEKLRAITDEIKQRKISLAELQKELESVNGKVVHQKKMERLKDKLTTQQLTLKDRIRVEKREINKLKNKESEGESLKVLKKIGDLQRKKIGAFSEIEPLIERIHSLSEKLLEAQVFAIQENNKFDTIKSLNESILSTRDDLQAERDRLRQLYRDSKDEYKKALTDYKEKLEELSEEQRGGLEELVSTMQANGTLTEEGLNAEINRLRSQMRLRRNAGGADTLKRLEECEEEINHFEEKIPEFEEEVNKLDRDIDRLVSVWKPKLESVIQVIADDFGANLQTVASAGDVQLESDSPNFAEWKLKILVSFRDNQELMQLNAAQQSGGEKSATTAVFLNSLQGLTNTPFRIVDEINQGMDSKNERLIHRLIVEKACSDKKASQYFLITPKLLTNLYYGDGMRVHCILAGRWCPEFSSSVEFLEMGVTSKYY